jgi:hypothetical protein
VINIASLSTYNSKRIGLPTSSFSAVVGLDIEAASPAGFIRHLEPYVPDIAQTRIQAELSKSVEHQGTDQPGIWVVRDDESAVEMVSDLAIAFEQQARPLLEQWTDLDQLYQLLLNADAARYEGGLGRAAVTYPGNPGSISRLSHLAVLSALRGDTAAEHVHLEALMRVGWALFCRSRGDPAPGHLPLEALMQEEGVDRRIRYRIVELDRAEPIQQGFTTDPT